MLEMDLNCIGFKRGVTCEFNLKNKDLNEMKKEYSITKSRNVNRWLLYETFIQYIEDKYFSGAMEVLEDRSISFEFKNFKSYYLN